MSPPGVSGAEHEATPYEEAVDNYVGAVTSRFITLVAGAVTAWPLVARAQQPGKVQPVFQAMLENDPRKRARTPTEPAADWREGRTGCCRRRDLKVVPCDLERACCSPAAKATYKSFNHTQAARPRRTARERMRGRCNSRRDWATLNGILTACILAAVLAGSMRAKLIASARNVAHTLWPHSGKVGPAQCRHGDARGLEVSPSSLLQNEFIQRQTETALRSRLFSSSRSFRHPRRGLGRSMSEPLVRSGYQCPDPTDYI
jgi:hypothetical protein